MLFRSYLSMAFRQVSKRKLFSFIHVLGLSVGITSFFFVAQYINFELSYDEFYPSNESIFRLALERKLDANDPILTAKNFAGLRELVGEDAMDVAAITAFYKTPANTGVFFRYNGRIFNEMGGEINADSSFFMVFSGLLLRGNPATALNDLNNVVLSESIAKKIFGEVDPIGQHIEMPDEDWGYTSFVVTGVFKDIPQNAHFHASFIIPLRFRWTSQEPWKDDFLMTYIRLKKGGDAASFLRRINQTYGRIQSLHPAPGRFGNLFSAFDISAGHMSLRSALVNPVDVIRKCLRCSCVDVLRCW